MKKQVCLLLVVLLLSLTACKQPNENGEANKSEEAITAFDAFLSGKRTALHKDGSTISIEEYLESATGEYAIYDMNDDDVPELLIKTEHELSIFWLKENVLVLWHNNNAYAKPLNNMAILSTRTGTAPQHTDYVYLILDYQGNESYKLAFSEYAPTEYQDVSYPAKYLINGSEVSKEVYDSTTSSITGLSDDKILWKPLND